VNDGVLVYTPVSKSDLVLKSTKGNDNRKEEERP
jgi:hypothetical protein